MLMRTKMLMRTPRKESNDLHTPVANVLIPYFLLYRSAQRNGHAVAWKLLVFTVFIILIPTNSSVHIQVNFSFVITYKIMFCQVLILIQLYVIMNKRAKQ